MGYADRRMVLNHKLGASISDNTDVNAILIPAGKEIMIFGLRVYKITASPTANAKIELVNSSNAVQLSAALDGSNGTQSEQTQSVPVTIAASASDTLLKLRTDQGTGVGCDCVIEVHYQYPGAN